MRFSLCSMIVYSGRADAWNHPSEFFFIFYRVTAYHVTWLTVKDTELNLKKAKKNLYYHLIDFHFQPLRLIIFEEGVVQYKGKYGNLKSSLFHVSKTQYQNQYHGNFMWVYLFWKLGTLILWSDDTSSFTSSKISRGSKIVIENWVDILFALGRKCFQHGN